MNRKDHILFRFIAVVVRIISYSKYISPSAIYVVCHIITIVIILEIAIYIAEFIFSKTTILIEKRASDTVVASSMVAFVSDVLFALVGVAGVVINLLRSLNRWSERVSDNEGIAREDTLEIWEQTLMQQYFSNTPENASNRTAAIEVSLSVVKAFKPEEVCDSENVVGVLVDEAVEGRIVPRGADTEFGHGTLDLIVQLVVPLVVTILTNALIQTGVVDLHGLKNLPSDIDREIDQLVARLTPQARFVLNRGQRTELSRLIRETIKVYLQSQSATELQSDSTRETVIHRLTSQRAALLEEHSAALIQWDSGGAVERVKLERKLKALEQQIEKIDEQLTRFGG